MDREFYGEDTTGEKVEKWLKKNWKFIVIGVFIVVLLFTTSYRMTSVKKISETTLAEKEKEVEKLKTEIYGLEAEVERQKMIAGDWYEMWKSELEASRWLADFYYDNVCNIEEDNEHCKSGVFE